MDTFPRLSHRGIGRSLPHEKILCCSFWLGKGYVVAQYHLKAAHLKARNGDPEYVTFVAAGRAEAA